jgi:hypothetical protein
MHAKRALGSTQGTMRRNMVLRMTSRWSPMLSAAGYEDKPLGHCVNVFRFSLGCGSMDAATGSPGKNGRIAAPVLQTMSAERPCENRPGPAWTRNARSRMDYAMRCEAFVHGLGLGLVCQGGLSHAALVFPRIGGGP